MVKIKFLDILGFLVLLAILVPSAAYSADYTPKDYVWTTQSKNSSESMPCGGHDIGMNVWVEKGDILFYVSQSGWFDENNTLLKAGRWRIHFDNQPADAAFKQRLCLDDGAIYITLGNAQIRLWADVMEPVVFCEMTSKKKLTTTVSYESWRYRDRPISKAECQQNQLQMDTPCGCRHFCRFHRGSKQQTTFLSPEPSRDGFRLYREAGIPGRNKKSDL